MNEEIDDTEFYHQDFTTASEWEIFIARMEEIIHQWKVDDLKDEENLNDNLLNESWSTRCEKLYFADVEFVLSHYKYILLRQEPDEDEDVKKLKYPMEKSYDFQLYTGSDLFGDYCLPAWYGLNEFITLSPVGSTGVTSETQIKLLLSSVQVAISNTSCSVPVFIQIREKWQRCYLGVFEGNGIRTNFEMVHLRRGPRHCQYLTGLLDLFKTKLMSPAPLEPVDVSVQFTYHLTDFGNFMWKQELPDSEGDNYDLHTLSMLPFGVTIDPVNLLVLKTTWSHLPDHSVVDSENYSDFDPMQAPKWIIGAKMIKDPVCLLSESMSEMVQILNNASTTYDVLGDYAVPQESIDNPLDLLTEPKLPTFSTVLKRAARNSLTKARRGTAPLSEDVLVPLLYFLFPDADEDPVFPYGDRNKDRKNSDVDASESCLENQCRGFKTCAEDTLPWRLSIVLAHCLLSLGGVKATAHLWFEFTQEMRYRWEKSILVPGLPAGFPDPRTCLLHQKLQMLNCCIERKKVREAKACETKLPEEEVFASSTDDEEFFDCSPPDEEDHPKRKMKHSLWNQPVGRSCKFGNLKLLKSGDPLYVPVTQEAVPKTEDQLEEDEDILLQLGTDAQGSELRAKMMSASLLSDMESFKAANPGSILEDFIRWYSPRDWIEDEDVDEWGQKKGRMSARMLISDNPWGQMWESAKPVPANRQKRLFDDTREAEKVLHFLDSRTLAQITEMVFPVLSHAAIFRLSEECEQVNRALSDPSKALQRIIKVVEKISRGGKPSIRKCDALVQEMSALELCVCQANSLLYKFNPQGTADEKITACVGKLVAGHEAEVEGTATSALGAQIISMFSDAQKAASMILTEQSSFENNPAGNIIFPRANEREFVMRVDAVRPAAYSAKCPQFLRTVLSKNEFRLVGAFSEDINFF